MFLNEALTKLKNLKSKATRIESYINNSAVHYEDQTPEFIYADELKNREAVQREIVELKSRIQKTNALTDVTYKGKTISLTELILTNASIRAEMAFLAQQSRWDANGNRYSGRTKDDVKQVLATGCDKVAFRKSLETLEKEKEELESVMANANASTKLQA